MHKMISPFLNSCKNKKLVLLKCDIDTVIVTGALRRI